MYIEDLSTIDFSNVISMCLYPDGTIEVEYREVYPLMVVEG